MIRSDRRERIGRLGAQRVHDRRDRLRACCGGRGNESGNAQKLPAALMQRQTKACQERSCFVRATFDLDAGRRIARRLHRQREWRLWQRDCWLSRTNFCDVPGPATARQRIKVSVRSEQR